MPQSRGPNPTKEDEQIEYVEMSTAPSTQDPQAIYFSPSDSNREESAVYDLANSSEVYRVGERAVAQQTSKKTPKKSANGWTKPQIVLVAMIFIISAGTLGFLLFQFLYGKVSFTIYLNQNIILLYMFKYSFYVKNFQLVQRHQLQQKNL